MLHDTWEEIVECISKQLSERDIYSRGSRAPRSKALGGLRQKILDEPMWLELRRHEARNHAAAGTRSTAFLTEEGVLMSCNAGQHGANAPVELLKGTRIRNINSGADFNTAVSNEGYVYTWGDGKLGRLGHCNGKDRVYTPTRLDRLTECRILSVAAGFGHCVAVAERGDLFSWGLNEDGQCGHTPGRGPVHLCPHRVKSLYHVIARSASAGKRHSLVVTEDGTLYTFGDDAVRTTGRHHEPMIVEFANGVRIKSAAAGHTHSLALTDAGEVFAWGRPEYGQLGLGPEAKTVTAPRLVPFDGLSDGVRCVEAGEHISCAVTTAGQLFTWGSGTELGHCDNGRRTYVPKCVQALKAEFVVAVSIAESHTIGVTRNGSVFGWGETESVVWYYTPAGPAFAQLAVRVLRGLLPFQMFGGYVAICLIFLMWVNMH